MREEATSPELWGEAGHSAASSDCNLIERERDGEKGGKEDGRDRERGEKGKEREEKTEEEGEIAVYNREMH